MDLIKRWQTEEKDERDGGRRGGEGKAEERESGEKRESE